MQKANELLQLKNDDAARPGLFANLSFCYLMLGNNKKAGEYGQLAYEAGKDSEDFTERKSIFEALYKYYKAIGKTPKAFEYLEQMQQASDTLNTESRKSSQRKSIVFIRIC